jgi:hypothetical protein
MSTATPNVAASVRARLLNIAKAQGVDFNQVLVRFAPTYTVVAEKLHAIALLGMANSRLKVYFDLSVLLDRETLDTDLLARAIKATFERRGMTVPETLPVGLTDEFAHDASRQKLWLAFLRKNELPPEQLPAIVGRLRVALALALNTAR